MSGGFRGWGGSSIHLGMSEVPSPELCSDPAPELQAVRTTLDAGSPAQAIAMGAALLPQLRNPTDQATLHLLMGRAELLNGRLGPAVQRFRLADRVGDGLQMGIWEAFSQYGAGGLDAVEHVVNEVEAAANGDGITLASIGGIRAWLHIERGQAAAGLALAQTANQQALAVGLPDLVALSWLVLALAQVTAGDVASGARSIATGIELGEQSGHAIAAPLFHMVATDLHQWRGNFGAVFHHAHAALSRSEPFTGGLVGVWAHGQLSVAADRRGELDLAADHLRNAEAALLRGVPLGWAHLAIARLRADRASAPERAALRLLDVWRYIAEHGTTGHLNLFALPVGPLLLTVNDVAIRAEFVARIGELRAPNPFDHMAISLARAVSENDLSEAIDLAESIERAGALFATPAADAFALIADLCSANQDRRARSFAEAARVLYSSIGAHGDERRLIERHPAIAGETDPVLSPAERRVVALMLEGCTNTEIGEQLYLSVKTVETHLGRVYRRFGVKSRTQLAAQLRHPR